MISSSSISVVSVPFDVTGDGPTMSLDGLMRCPECALRKEFGRSDWESVELVFELVKFDCQSLVVTEARIEARPAQRTVD